MLSDRHKELLLSALACPACRGEFAAAQDRLRCQRCGHQFAIAGSCIDFLFAKNEAATRGFFSFLWGKRFRGFFEANSSYGRPVAQRADELRATMPEDAPQIILDVGCGPGDITVEIARRCPASLVIGVDFSESVEHLGKRDDLPVNLVAIKADLQSLPFRWSGLDFVYSIGVLHHTADTERAFIKIARLVKECGRFVAWLYPDPVENTWFRLYYRIRDRHFLGVGHRLPNAARLLLVYAYSVLMYPYFRLGAYKAFMTYTQNTTSARKFIGQTALIVLDDIAPTFQHRPLQSEVRQWYLNEGFSEVSLNEQSLLYCGARIPYRDDCSNQNFIHEGFPDGR